MNETDIGFNRYLREIGRFPLLTPQQEIDLAQKIKRGDAKAREQMINSNLRLVVTIAHDYVNLGLPLLDLISEGNIGLTKAVERFDAGKGAKLSTYAAWWIKQSIKRALANQSKTIRLPVHLVDKIAKVRRVSLQMSDELGREPTDDELGEELGIASEKVGRLKSAGIRPASLDAPIADNDSTEFAEVIGDDEAQTPFELLRDKNLRREVEGLIAVLDSREKENHFPAVRSRRRKTENAGRCGPGFRRHSRTHSTAAKHCFDQTPPRVGQERRTRRTADRSLTRKNWQNGNTRPFSHKHSAWVHDAQSVNRPDHCMVFRASGRLEAQRCLTQ